MNFASVFCPAIGGLGLVTGIAIIGRLTWSLLFVAVITSVFASIALNVILRRRTRQLHHR